VLQGCAEWFNAIRPESVGRSVGKERLMGQRQLHRLSARTLSTKTRCGRYGDGGGLYLEIARGGTKAWIFRYRFPLTKKTRYMGLGALHGVGLPAAREKAATQRNLILSGLDPTEVREEENRKRAAEVARAVTFAQCAAAYLQSHRPGWRSEQHGDQWERTIQIYCDPVIGPLAVPGCRYRAHPENP